MIIAFLLNITVLASSAVLARRYFARDAWHYRLLSLSALFYAQIVFIQLFWGVLGKLYLSNIVLSVLIIFFICYFLFRQGSPSSAKMSLMPDNLISRELLTNKTVIFCSSILLGFALVKLAINLVNPPFGWDSLNYHFTFPVEWLKQANLQNPITINDDLAPSYYPINGSLVYLWLILPLKNVFLADLGQIPFFIISFLAVYGICRRIGITSEYSFYAAGLFAITPNYFKQMEIAYVDVMVCAWFLAGVCFLLAFYYQGKIKDAILFTISLGLLIGTKTLALPYGAVLLIAFTLIFLRRCKSFGLKNTLFFVFILSVLIAVFGGYGYIRNYLQTGNPVYPMKVDFLGKEIFRGVYDKANYSVRISSGDYSLNKILFHEGMGAGAIVFLLPGLFFYVLKIFRKKIITYDKILIFLVPIALLLIWRYIIPMANLRYLYPGLALGYAAAFSVFSINKPYRNILRVLVILCFIASCPEISNHRELVFSLLLSAAFFLSLNRIYALVLKLRIRHWLLLTLAGILALSAANIDYNKNEYKRYIKMVKYSGLWPEAAQAWNWLNENTGGNNIAYVGRPVPFPLYGTNFKNNVFYVSVNEVDPAMIHYFPQSRYRWGKDFLDLHKSLEAEGNYRQHPDYSAWHANLKRRSADYIFVYSLHQTKEIIFPIEDAWAGGHPDNFSLSFSNQIVHIYKLI